MFLLFLVLGLFIGSFLNVVVDRIPKNQSIVFPPSHCDHCKKHILWYDLIPVISFALLKGRCRFCKTKLSFYYPLVEMITGVLFAFTFTLIIQPSILQLQQSNLYALFSTVNVIFYLFIVSSLIVIFFTDIKSGIIPDKILLTASVLTFIWLVVSSQQLLVAHLLSALGAFLFFLLIHVVSRGRGMGFGDVKLVFFLGLLLGFPGIFFALYIAFLTGAAVGVSLILLKKKKLHGSTVPFGPFLVLGTLVIIFWGNYLIAKALSFL